MLCSNYMLFHLGLTWTKIGWKLNCSCHAYSWKATTRSRARSSCSPLKGTASALEITVSFKFWAIFQSNMTIFGHWLIGFINSSRHWCDGGDPRRKGHQGWTGLLQRGRFLRRLHHRTCQPHSDQPLQRRQKTW